MTRVLRLAAFWLVACLPLAAAHAADFTPAQRAEIVQIMRDAMKNDPSAARAVAVKFSCCVASPTEPAYCGRQPPLVGAVEAISVSQSGLLALQLAKPTSHTEAVQPRPSPQVYIVLASMQAGSLQRPQLGSLPSVVSQPGVVSQSAVVESAHPIVTH